MKINELFEATSLAANKRDHKDAVEQEENPSFYDKANPAHQAERRKREAAEKTAKLALKSYKASNYPIIDHEHKRHLFDTDLVDHLRHEYTPKAWAKMSELDQIVAQLDFVSMSAPPGKDFDMKKYDERLKAKAKELQAKIKR